MRFTCWSSGTTVEHVPFAAHVERIARSRQLRQHGRRCRPRQEDSAPLGHRTEDDRQDAGPLRLLERFMKQTVDEDRDEAPTQGALRLPQVPGRASQQVDVRQEAGYPRPEQHVEVFVVRRALLSTNEAPTTEKPR